MTGFFNAVSASFILLVLMSIGYVMGHLGWMTEQEKKFVSKYVVNIAVPCNCIVGLLNHLDRSTLAQAGPMLLSTFISIGVMMLLAIGLATLLRLPRERWGVFITMTGLSNTLFIGIPVCTQLFGDGCMGFLMMYYLANTSYLQTAGLMLVKRSGTAPGGKVTVPGVVKDMLTKPPILAVLLTLALLVTDLRLPQPVMKCAEYVSNSVSPLALIYCGYIVYELGLKNLRFEKGLGVMVLFRLMISPIICATLCSVFGITGLPHDVFVVGAGLPVVSQITVMAGNYGADDKYAATGATLSTFGSFLSIPIMMVLLG